MSYHGGLKASCGSDSESSFRSWSGSKTGKRADPDRRDFFISRKKRDDESVVSSSVDESKT